MFWIQQPAIDKRALNPKVMEVMAQLPRHRFVPEKQQPYAYGSGIGHGQTISQPLYRGSDERSAAPDFGHRILELEPVQISGSGAGSNGRAGVHHRDHRAAGAGGGSIRRVGIRQHLHPYRRWLLADGRARYISTHIVVTAAASHVPPPLIDQLKPGGRGHPGRRRFSGSAVDADRKQEDGGIKTRQILPVRFVPLTGSH